MEQSMIFACVAVFAVCFVGVFTFMMVRARRELAKSAFGERTVVTELTGEVLKPWFVENAAPGDLLLMMNGEAAARVLPNFPRGLNGCVLQMIMDPAQEKVKKMRLVEFSVMSDALKEKLEKGKGTVSFTQA